MKCPRRNELRDYEQTIREVIFRNGIRNETECGTNWKVYATKKRHYISEMVLALGAFTECAYRYGSLIWYNYTPLLFRLT